MGCEGPDKINRIYDGTEAKTRKYQASWWLWWGRWGGRREGESLADVGDVGVHNTERDNLSN